jgi:capsular polysaccharide biosynthesis protein
MPPSPSEPSVNLELRDYLGILKRRKALIALLTAIAVVATLVVSLLTTPQYKASGGLIIQSNDLDAVLSGDATTTNATPEQVLKERQIMGSSPTANAIRKKLGYLPEVKVAKPEDKTTIVGVTSISSSKAKATKAVNDFLVTYVAVRTDSLKAQVEQAIAETKKATTQIDVETAFSRQRIDQIAVELAGELTPSQRLLLEAERDRLTAESQPEAVAARQAELQGRLSQLSQAKASYDSHSSYTVSMAFPPEKPISPRPIRNTLLALAFGLLFALVVAFIRDYFDDTFRTKEDVDAFTGRIPILGIVPAISEWRDRKTALLESVSHPSSAAAEAYRSLRTGLEFLGIDRKIHIVHVTSSASGEGKSTTSANLAVSLARAGKHVVLVDCDLRRPRMHEFFGMDNAVGLTSLILGTASIEEALVPAPGIPGLMILASGPPPPHPPPRGGPQKAPGKQGGRARGGPNLGVD